MSLDNSDENGLAPQRVTILTVRTPVQLLLMMAEPLGPSVCMWPMHTHSVSTTATCHVHGACRFVHVPTQVFPQVTSSIDQCFVLEKADR